MRGPPFPNRPPFVPRSGPKGPPPPVRVITPEDGQRPSTPEDGMPVTTR